MKNAQPVSAPMHLLVEPAGGVLYDTLLANGRPFARPVAAASPWLEPATSPALNVLKKDDPNVFLDFLEHLKYTPEQIERIHQLATKVAQLATTVGWIVGAVFTVKDVLELLGVLDKDEESERLQKEIALKVDAIYKYLQQTEKQDQYALAVSWRGKVQGTRTSISNLALSRSEDNLDTLRQTGRTMMDECLYPMLDVGMGEIPFIRTTYGGFPTPHTYVNTTPSHWTEYAFPLWMQTTGGVPVNLTSAADLAASIWDPGYYLDVLVEAVGVRVAALAALEPAFRSTGHDRDDLRTIQRGLTALVSKWEQSLFKTAVVGPIDPEPDLYGDHRLYHPWIGPPKHVRGTWMEFGNKPALPLGTVDPVSGVAAFDPFWRDGLDLQYNGLADYWYVANYAAAVSAAYTQHAAMLELVRERSGLRRLRKLRDSVAALVGPPSGSEFASVSEATFERQEIASGTSAQVTYASTEEEVDLGVIGTFAGKPGKKYKAKRAFQPAVKRFRVPMARRTDISKIQLGYRVRFTVGHGAMALDPDLPIDESATLSKFSNVTIPEQVPPLFPSTPQVHELRSDHAAVYDVLQSGVFSPQEETLYESSGAVPGKHRLYLDRRAGKVAARVKVAFEFDAQNPDHAFMGFANVSVGTLDGATARDGFIIFVEVFETRVAALEGPPRDEVREDPVAALTLHFAPSFLVVEPDYFKDREAGLKALEAAVDSIEGKYSQSKMLLGPLEPITQIQRVAEEQELVLDLFGGYADRSPELAEQLTETFAVPALRWG